MHRKWEKNAPVPQVTGLRGQVIDPFRGGGWRVTALRERAAAFPPEMEVYETGIR